MKLLVFYILKYIGYRAIQYKAQRIQRFCANGLPVLHPVQDVRGKAVSEYKLIFRYAFVL
jgi:hypothetical protein